MDVGIRHKPAIDIARPPANHRKTVDANAKMSLLGIPYRASKMHVIQ